MNCDFRLNYLMARRLNYLMARRCIAAGAQRDARARRREGYTTRAIVAVSTGQRRLKGARALDSLLNFGCDSMASWGTGGSRAIQSIVTCDHSGRMGGMKPNFVSKSRARTRIRGP